VECRSLFYFSSFNLELTQAVFADRNDKNLIIRFLLLWNGFRQFSAPAPVSDRASHFGWLWLGHMGEISL